MTSAATTANKKMVAGISEPQTSGIYTDLQCDIIYALQNIIM